MPVFGAVGAVLKYFSVCWNSITCELLAQPMTGVYGGTTEGGAKFIMK